MSSAPRGVTGFAESGRHPRVSPPQAAHTPRTCRARPVTPARHSRDTWHARAHAVRQKNINFFYFRTKTRHWDTKSVSVREGGKKGCFSRILQENAVFHVFWNRKYNTTPKWTPIMLLNLHFSAGFSGIFGVFRVSIINIERFFCMLYD
jgi:hypothetical protein